MTAPATATQSNSAHLAIAETLSAEDRTRIAWYISESLCTCAITALQAKPLPEDVKTDLARDLDRAMQRHEVKCGPVALDDLAAPLAARIAARFDLEPEDAGRMGLTRAIETLIDSWKKWMRNNPRHSFERVALKMLDDTTLIRRETAEQHDKKLIREEIARRINSRKTGVSVQMLESALA